MFSLNLLITPLRLISSSFFLNKILFVFRVLEVDFVADETAVDLLDVHRPLEGDPASVDVLHHDLGVKHALVSFEHPYVD